MMRICQYCLVMMIAASIGYGTQPKVGTGHGEPLWPDLLKQQWGLEMDRDLRNPLVEGVAPASLFQRVDKKKPVTFRPIIALGMETTTRGGWYPASERADIWDFLYEMRGGIKEVWAYTYKQPESQMKSGKFTEPPLDSGSGEFDPGERRVRSR